MIIIGVDPYKRVHTAGAVDPATNRRLASVEIEPSLVGYPAVRAVGACFAERRWAVENARGLGRHRAQCLVARGERVDEVASSAMARVRGCYVEAAPERLDQCCSRGQRGALHRDANTVVPED